MSDFRRRLSANQGRLFPSLVHWDKIFQNKICHIFKFCVEIKENVFFFKLTKIWEKLVRNKASASTQTKARESPNEKLDYVKQLDSSRLFGSRRRQNKIELDQIQLDQIEWEWTRSDRIEFFYSDKGFQTLQPDQV